MNTANWILSEIIFSARIMTLKDLAKDWIKARAALKQQIKIFENDAAFLQAELSEDVR